MILHIDQRQQVIAFDQLGILVQNFAKLNSSHILMTFPAKSQGIIIFSYCLINSIQFIRIRLKTINIFIRNIPGRLQILTDHPLAKSSDHLSHFKIHKTQKISRLDISLVKGKALLQTVNSS